MHLSGNELSWTIQSHMSTAISICNSRQFRMRATGVWMHLLTVCDAKIHPLCLYEVGPNPYDPLFKFIWFDEWIWYHRRTIHSAFVWISWKYLAVPFTMWRYLFTVNKDFGIWTCWSTVNSYWIIAKTKISYSYSYWMRRQFECYNNHLCAFLFENIPSTLTCLVPSWLCERTEPNIILSKVNLHFKERRKPFFCWEWVPSILLIWAF